MSYPQHGAPQAAYAPTPAYASWFSRVGAWIVDGLPGAALGLLGYVIAGPRIDATTGQVSGGGALYFLFFLAAFAVGVYNRWYLAGKTGQSWGRKALGIKLVGEATGQPVGFGLALGRDFAHFLDAIPCGIGLGFLWPL